MWWNTNVISSADVAVRWWWKIPNHIKKNRYSFMPKHNNCQLANSTVCESVQWKSWWNRQSQSGEDWCGIIVHHERAVGADKGTCCSFLLLGHLCVNLVTDVCIRLQVSVWRGLIGQLHWYVIREQHTQLGGWCCQHQSNSCMLKSSLW